MTKEATLKKEKKQLKKQLKQLNRQLKEIYPSKQYSCSGCSKRTQIKNVSIIKQHAYREPFSCTGGDYWYFDEYLIYCPKCSECSRAYDLMDYDKKKYKKGKIPKYYERFLFVQEYYDHFKEHLDWYKRRSGLFSDPAPTIEQLREDKEKKDRGW